MPTRRAALFGAALALCGCGFAPVYAPGGNAEALHGQVSYTVPDTVEGYRILTRLEQRLGRASAEAAYRLDVALVTEELGAAITPEGAVTRFTITGVAEFTLIDRAAATALVSGRTDSFTGYSTTDSTVATENARDDAIARLATILGDQIVTQISARLAAAP